MIARGTAYSRPSKIQMLFAIPESWEEVEVGSRCGAAVSYQLLNRPTLAVSRKEHNSKLDRRCHVIVGMICHHPLVPNRSVKNLVQLKNLMKKKIAVFSLNSVRESKSNPLLQCIFLVFDEYAGIAHRSARRKHSGQNSLLYSYSTISTFQHKPSQLRLPISIFSPAKVNCKRKSRKQEKRLLLVQLKPNAPELLAAANLP